MANETFCVMTIEHGGPLYEKMVGLRDRVLRQPLGLSFNLEDLAGEANDILCGAVGTDQVLLGCLVLTRRNSSTFQMRQVAVEASHQSTGIGSQLVRYSEELGRYHRTEKMMLHARDTAVPFYLRLGYEIVGSPFEEVSIPHFKMEKQVWMATNSRG